jgi:hypothetical protein
MTGRATMSTRRSSRFLGRAFSLMLAIALLLPMFVLQPAGAQDPERERFHFEHGPPPPGWVVEDRRPDTDWYYQMVDLYFSSYPEAELEWLPYVYGFVRRNPPGFHPITMERCLSGDLPLRDVADQSLLDPNSHAWGMAGTLRAAEFSPFTRFETMVGGLDATVTEWHYVVERYDGSRGEPPRDVWVPVAKITSRFYCIGAPDSVVWIGFAAQEDWLGQVLQFIDTFEFRAATPIRLCPEAIDYFSSLRIAAPPLDENTPTNLRVDYSQLHGQMFGAIERYNGLFPDGNHTAYVSLPPWGTLDAIDWLAIEGGLTFNVTGQPHLSHVFAFDDRYDLAWFGKGRLGTESGLRNSIMEKAKEQNGRRQDPGDVFFLALIHTDGDARLAALLAHNTLRSLARQGEYDWVTLPDGSGYMVNYGDVEFTGVETDRAFFTTYLSPIRGFEEEELPDDPFDNSGVWYHLFGTMFYELQTKSDKDMIGPSLLGVAAVPGEVIVSAHEGNLPKFGREPHDPTYGSDFSNRFEQFTRHYVGRKPDPEKYCINVWGSQVAADLFDHAFLHAMAPDWRVTDPDFDPGDPVIGMKDDYRIGAKPHSDIVHVELRERYERLQRFFIDQTPAAPTPRLQRPQEPPGDVPAGGSAGSPVSITWHSDAGTLILHQPSRGLYGDAPLLLIPIYDLETHTWGASWFDFHSEPYTMFFEGSESGTMYLTLFEPEIGLAGTWSAPVVEGDRLSLDVVPGRVDFPLVREDGSEIAPIISQLPPLDLSDVSPPDTPPAPGPGTEPGQERPPTDTDGSGDGGLGPGVVLLGIGLVLGLGGLAILALIIMLVRRGSKSPPLTARPAPPPHPQPTAPPAATRAPVPAPRPSPRPQERSGAATTTVSACRSCGAPVGPRDRFCTRCGMPVVALRQAPITGSRFCSRCGRPLDTAARFCIECGAPVEQTPKAS